MNASENAGKRPYRKTTKNATSNPPKKIQCSFRLTPEAAQRVAVHAAMLDIDRSELVERLINEHLRRFIVSDRGRESIESEGIPP